MSKKFIIISICLIIIVIVSVTTYKIIKNHNDNLMQVSEKYIIEKASLCFEEKKCTEESVTLKELYKLKYLDIQVNPISKEYYKEDSYIKKEGDTYEFIIVN